MSESKIVLQNGGVGIRNLRKEEWKKIILANIGLEELAIQNYEKVITKQMIKMFAIF